MMAQTVGWPRAATSSRTGTTRMTGHNGRFANVCNGSKATAPLAAAMGGKQTQGYSIAFRCSAVDIKPTKHLFQIAWRVRSFEHCGARIIRKLILELARVLS